MFTINLSFSAGFQKPKHLALPQAEPLSSAEHLTLPQAANDPTSERTAQGIDNILHYSFTLPEGDDA